MRLSELTGELRVLRREPLFAATTILLVAFGIAAATTLASATRHFVLRPLPGIERQAELVNLHRATREEPFGGLSVDEFRQLARDASAFAGIAAMRDQGVHLSDGGENALAVAQVVSGNYFGVLGARPTLGRLLAPEDDAPGALPVVVLDHGLWERRFGRDPRVLGRDVRLNGRSFTVVGVAPARFAGTFLGFRFDLFLPLSSLSAAAPGPSSADRGVELVARRSAEATPGAIDADLARLTGELTRLDAARWRDASLHASPTSGVEPSLRGAALAFFSAVGAIATLAVLAIAANLASLLLARNARRRHELAIRAALGARRRELLRTLALPALALFSVGGLAGVGLSFAGTRALASFAPSLAVPLDFDLRPDLPTMIAGLALALALGLAVSGLTALRASRVDPAAALRGARGEVAAPAARWRALLVAAQVGIAILLLVPAALFVTSTLAAAAIDPGYRIADVSTTALEVGLLGLDADSERRLVERVVGRLATLPGVEGAAAASRFPLALGRESREVEHSDSSATPRERVDSAAVSAGYFALLDVPLVGGRDFDATDRADTQARVIVNEAAAVSWWPREDAVGQSLRVDGSPCTVIGIVRDGRARRPWEPSRPAIYLPLTQQRAPRLTLALRSALPATSLAPLVREVLHAEAPDLAVLPLQPSSARLLNALLPQRAGGAIASALGGAAALLAALGLYALLAHQVAASRREIGLRIALGAEPKRIISQFVKRGIRFAVPGLVLGTTAAAIAARLLRPLLPGTIAATVPVLVAVPTALLFLALAAAWIPARRAARIDPMIALREG